MSEQLEFDCGGYTNGTSGGPFLTNVSPASGDGWLIGLIGGYQQGGDSPDVSYSPRFSAAVQSLYQTTVSAAVQSLYQTTASTVAGPG
jgi:hypothetical protein